MELEHASPSHNNLQAHNDIQRLNIIAIAKVQRVEKREEQTTAGVSHIRG